MTFESQVKDLEKFRAKIENAIEEEGCSEQLFSMFCDFATKYRMLANMLVKKNDESDKIIVIVKRDAFIWRAAAHIALDDLREVIGDNY